MQIKINCKMVYTHFEQFGLCQTIHQVTNLTQRSWKRQVHCLSSPIESDICVESYLEKPTYECGSKLISYHVFICCSESDLIKAIILITIWICQKSDLGCQSEHSSTPNQQHYPSFSSTPNTHPSSPSRCAGPPLRVIKCC